MIDTKRSLIIINFVDLSKGEAGVAKSVSYRLWEEKDKEDRKSRWEDTMSGMDDSQDDEDKSWDEEESYSYSRKDILQVSRVLKELDPSSQ